MNYPLHVHSWMIFKSTLLASRSNLKNGTDLVERKMYEIGYITISESQQVSIPCMSIEQTEFPKTERETVVPIQNLNLTQSGENIGIRTWQTHHFQSSGTAFVYET
jgi:hypothetical protein